MKLISRHALISIFVQNQEEALSFYTSMLGLEKRTDITFGPGLRLLTVASQGQQKPEIALAIPHQQCNATVQEETSHEERRKPWIFTTDNCHQDYERLRAHGVTFVHTPAKQLYGVEATFVDPYGNTFVLLETTPEVLTFLDPFNISSAA